MSQQSELMTPEQQEALAIELAKVTNYSPHGLRIFIGFIPTAELVTTLILEAYGKGITLERLAEIVAPALRRAVNKPSV